MVWPVPGAPTDKVARVTNHLAIFLEEVQLYNTREMRRLAPHSPLPLLTFTAHP